MKRFSTRLSVRLLQLYRASLSVFFGPACRFEPTCSRYAEAAITRFGLARGSWLAAQRVARCHPLGGNGYDPIPERVGDGS
jgi:putative membrane protein insertion efficiency factor